MLKIKEINSLIVHYGISGMPWSMSLQPIGNSNDHNFAGCKILQQTVWIITLAGTIDFLWQAQNTTEHFHLRLASPEPTTDQYNGAGLLHPSASAQATRGT